ncbi:hypothetical protein PRUPE_8G262700 [Prunus persica]|uniref:Uncharacterized protein n=1 Tax=Prunus persica TaxID=3760 RepID=M5VL18_PRUPE|nr:hypothetical protein PRUPE_8G262700 [Prunus persica]
MTTTSSPSYAIKENNITHPRKRKTSPKQYLPRIFWIKTHWTKLFQQTQELLNLSKMQKRYQVMTNKLTRNVLVLDQLELDYNL